MGIVIFEDTRKAELEDFRQMLLSCAAVQRRKDDDGFKRRENTLATEDGGDALDRMVCVTSGVSYLGIAIVNHLLVNGYSVRIIVDNEEDVDKLREMEISGEMRLADSIVEVVMAKLTEVESLTEAFQGCYCVCHTCAFVDPAGLSGYTKAMADIEVNASKNVMTACKLSPSVRHCVLTSSLLACIWRDDSLDEFPPLVDHKCWSDESICMSKKLWYALGKLRAEKAAWEIAKDGHLKLVTICPGLVTGPEFYNKSPTSTIAYLKGMEEMYRLGLLATVDIKQLAKAHVSVLEQMKKTACGRYICFDRVIKRDEEIRVLACQTGLNLNASPIVSTTEDTLTPQFELSKTKLDRLLLASATPPRCCQ
ncbi:cinnamoyl-CoA reductase-like SNL6 [Andrographis paniculata]|uniref:cinnamoyl-CoA reductase-like SNL6 n=1 Tax=Andrographis paniculata TaxID=175694 RepID=UPI0021E90654|nr:cinnamoyl-CoA reductase-like SNL6 [Andrographis paniculata]